VTTTRTSRIALAILAFFFALDPAAAAAESRSKGVITPGRPFSGSITDADRRSGDYHQWAFSHHDWTYKGRAGERVVVTGASERDGGLVDFSLFIRTVAGESMIAKSSLGRKLDVRLPADGEYILCVASVSDQQYNLVLTSAPPDESAPPPRQIFGGVPVTGQVTDADEKQEENRHQDWTFFGQAGERITIALSGAGGGFSPFAALYAPKSNGFLGEAQSAAAGFVLPMDGIYTLCIHSHGDAPDTGAFALAVQSTGVLDEWDSMQTFREDGTGLGMLGYFINDKVDAWYFFGAKDEQVQITMRPKKLIDSDEDFDTYLRLGRIEDGRFRELASDDDGAGGTASRLNFRLPASGMYVVRASAYQERAVESHYDISLERMSK